MDAREKRQRELRTWTLKELQNEWSAQQKRMKQFKAKKITLDQLNVHFIYSDDELIEALRRWKCEVWKGTLKEAAEEVRKSVKEYANLTEASSAFFGTHLFPNRPKLTEKQFYENVKKHVAGEI